MAPAVKDWNQVNANFGNNKPRSGMLGNPENKKIKMNINCYLISYCTHYTTEMCWRPQNTQKCHVYFELWVQDPKKQRFLK